MKTLRRASLGIALVVLGCGLEHPISRFPDVVDAAVAPDAPAPPDLPTPVDVVAPGDTATPLDAPTSDDVIDASAKDVGDDAQEPDVVDAPAVEDVAVDAGETVYESCEAARRAGRPSGAYLVRVGGTVPWRAWCDTSDGGGAWTLVLKADGRRLTFTYDAPIWTNTELLHPDDVTLNRDEAKFQGFVGLPVRELRVQMVAPDAALSTARPIVLAVNRITTLQQIFAAGQYVDLEGSTRETEWLGLVADARIQGACNRRGLNVRGNNGSADRVRIGMIGNEWSIDPCNSHDSRVGVGGGGSACGSGRETNTVGNAAGCMILAWDNRDIRAFAYVWVR